MIFQDSQSSLNPTKTIGEQVAEPVRLHRGASKKEGHDRALEVLELVGLPRPKERLADYPHQLSGGLRQRVMIAIALACEPRVLIADEPTTALDVTIQAQILSVLDELKERLGMATLLVTHDMGVVAGRTDRINVMYAGRLVETAPTDELFAGDAPSVHAGAAGFDPEARFGPDQGAGDDSRHPAGSDRPAVRLPVRAALSVRDRQVPRAGAAADRARTRGTCSRAGIRSTVRSRSDRRSPASPRPRPRRRRTGRRRMAAATARLEHLLSVQDVVREYPVTAGALLQRKVASVKAVSGVTLHLDRARRSGWSGSPAAARPRSAS